MYDRFTIRARQVMQLANDEASRSRHDYIGTEHILLAIVREGSGVAATVLMNHGINLEGLRSHVERNIKAGTGGEGVRIPQTPRAKKVIEFAIEEARSLNHQYVGTEHVLLGLLREKDGVAGRVLVSMGLSCENLRDEILRLLGVSADRPVICETKAHYPLSVFRQSQSLIDVIIEMFEQVQEAAITNQDFTFAAEVRDEKHRLLTVREFVSRQLPR